MLVLQIAGGILIALAAILVLAIAGKVTLKIVGAVDDYFYKRKQARLHH